MSKFWAGEGDSHTSLAKVTILLLQDLSTLCVKDIYGICFHLSAQRS